MSSLRECNIGVKPCGGNCSLKESAHYAGVSLSRLAGDPKPLVMHKGFVATGMAFAEDGIMFWDGRGCYLGKDESAIGWVLPDKRVFAKLDTCGNYASFAARVEEPSDSLPGLLPSSGQEADSASPGSPVVASRFLGGFSLLSARNSYSETHRETIQKEPHVPPVPLPDSLGLLFMALLAAALWSHRRD